MGYIWKWTAGRASVLAVLTEGAAATGEVIKIILFDSDNFYTLHRTSGSDSATSSPLQAFDNEIWHIIAEL